ncbi:MAG: IPT/TIG domain-containing protein [Myxococcota bacterium]
MSAVIPPGTAGVVDVLLVNPDGKSATLAGGFAYYSSTQLDPPPVLSSVVPPSGSTEGTTSVTLSGTGFKDGAIAFVGGVAVETTFVSESQLDAQFPPRAAGAVDVVLTNPDGQSSTLAGAFTYVAPPPPVIDSLDPTVGYTTETTRVTITGSAFRDGVVVSAGGVEAVTTFLSGTTLQAEFPPHAEGAVDVTVTNPDGQAVTAAGAFTYLLPPPPVLLLVSPASGYTSETTTVTLSGSGFSAQAVVLVDGEEVEATVESDTRITAELPPHDAGLVDVVVRNPDGQEAVATGAFLYEAPPPPTVVNVRPSVGNAGEATLVTITGTGFRPGALVTVGGLGAISTYVSSTELTAIFPAHAAGFVDVTVTNQDGQSSTLGNAFSYVTAPPPTITSVSPDSALTVDTTLVTVTGSNFTSTTVVSVDGVDVDTVVISAFEASATFPPHAAGDVDVTVTNGDGQSAVLPGGFTYINPPPTVDSVNPAVAPPSGNTSVVVSGSGFLPGADVYFGGLLAGSTTLDSGAIRAVAPAGNPGFVDVTVQNPDGQTATLPAAFEYRAGYVPAPPPTIASLLPDRGPATGGTKLLLRGTNFSAGMTVELGTGRAVATVVSSTEATVVTPAGMPGAVDVVVVNTDGQYGTLLRGFTYVDPATYTTPAPRVSGATPNRGPETTSTSLYITGSGFQAGAIFFVRDLVAANILFMHPGLLRGAAPPQPFGPADLTVTNPDGRSATLTNAFLYEEAPSVAAVSPPRGPSSGGTEVLVSGSGFHQGSAVYFGAGQSPSVQVLSNTLLQAITPPGPKGLVDVRVVSPDGQASTLSAGFEYVAPPSVTSLTPATGPSTGGTVLVLTGAELQDGVRVTVGGVDAAVDRADDGTLVVTMPPGTAGNATVVVINPDGQQSGGVTFTYVNPASLGQAPTLTSINPSKGPDVGGTYMAFYGTGFVNNATLIVGPRPLGNARVVDAGRATGVTAPGVAGPALRVAITNPDGQSAVLPAAFTYLTPDALPPAPQAFNVTPNSGSIFGGDTATVSGQAFTAGSFVLIDGVPQDSTFVDGNTLEFQAGPYILGVFDLTVTTAEGQSITLQDAWNYIIPPPQILAVNPSTGFAVGGTTITLNGRNFLSGAAVYVGGAAASDVNVLSPFLLTAVTPPGSDGPAAISVVNVNGGSATLPGGPPDGFTYVAAPYVDAVSPTSGPTAGGTDITVTGNFFRAGAEVRVGGNLATNVTVVSATAITATTPAGAGGPAAVTVTNTDGQTHSLAGGFTYLVPVPPPSVTSVSPNYGPVAGGTTVAIRGNRFQVGLEVRFGSALATDVVVISSTNLTCRAPGGTPNATVDVTITNPDNQSASLPSAFTYVPDQQLPPLVILGISPNTGGIAGGTRMTVSGRGIQNGAQLTVGGLAATNVVWLGPTALAADTPPHAAGLVDVTITNPDTQYYTAVNGFRYNAGGRYQSAGQRLPMESGGAKRGGVLFDWDRDGDSDMLLVRANTNANNRPFFHRNDNGTLVDVTSVAVNWTGVPNDDVRDALVGDIDGDLDDDVILVGNCYRTILRNDGGTFAMPSGGAMYGVCNVRTGAMGDLNGDGRLDFVVGGFQSQEQKYINNAASPGTFTVTTFGLNDATTAVVLGDFDGEGDLDLFVANYYDQQKQLYLNDGAGNLIATSPGIQFPITAGNSTTAATRDLNGDGKLDIILGNDGQQDRIFFNNGFGTFTDSSAGNMPSDTDATQQIIPVDVDSDGDADLAAIRTNGSRPRLYLNDGAGRFSNLTATNLPASLGEYTVAFAVAKRPAGTAVDNIAEASRYDLNSDGYADLILVNEAAQNRLLENYGVGSAGVFRYRTQTVLPEENEFTTNARGADLDGDGFMDVVKVVLTGFSGYCPPVATGGALRLLVNDGAGNLFDESAVRLPALDLRASDVALFDADNDNDTDIMVVQTYHPGSNPNYVYLLLNDGTGVFEDVSQLRLPSGNRDLDNAFAISTIDFNLDGHTDVLVATNQMVRLWQNVGPGYFMDVTPGSGLDTLPGTMGCAGIQGTSFGTAGVSVGDLDGDTWPDIFLTRNGYYNPYPTDLVIFNLGGSGRFQDLTTSRLPSAPFGLRSLLFDADGDSDQDVYVINGGDDRLYLNLGGSLSDVTLSSLPARVDATTGAAIVDVDKDGLLDIFLGKNDGYYTDSFNGSTTGRPNRLLVNVGNGNFQDFTAEKLPVSDDNTVSVVVGDFNGDGDDDLYIANMGQSRMFYRVP